MIVDLWSNFPWTYQMEVPTIFTFRVAASKTVADLLRPCMQNTIGPKRFEKILRELNHLHHDRLELQYLINSLKKRESGGGYFMSTPEYFHHLLIKRITLNTFYLKDTSVHSIQL